MFLIRLYSFFVKQKTASLRFFVEKDRIGCVYDVKTKKTEGNSGCERIAEN